MQASCLANPSWITQRRRLKRFGKNKEKQEEKRTSSMIFSPGVRCECVLSVLVHLWISTSNAHTQHGRIFNIKVARFNDHYLIAGPYSEHVEHGRCYGDTKSCSLLCLKGLLIFILAFCLNILCPLTHIHFLQFALRGMMEALYLELRADKPDSKVGNFLHHSFIWRSPGLISWIFWKQYESVSHPQVKLTTIHPFTVDTGLAKKPRSRLQTMTIIEQLHIAHFINPDLNV